MGFQGTRLIRGETQKKGTSLLCTRGTKSPSMSTRCGVRRSAVFESAHPQQTPLKLHEEAWAGLLQNPGLHISQEVEIVPGCAVAVACPSFPDNSPVSLGPGRVIRNMLGWSLMEETERSGVWLFRGTLEGEKHFSSLSAAGDWVKKESYHTAWSVPCGSSRTCSYAYGQGPAVGPHTGDRCWPLPAGVWRAIAPQMMPWCAEGVLPTAANLNLYRERSSRVAWHSDNEPLFGERGESKLIVSMSFGTRARFKWNGESCPDSEADSCWLDHGDLLVMDGQCQDEFLHCTGPGLEQERIFVTFWWIKQHVATCPFLRTGVACCVPTVQGSSVSVTKLVGKGAAWGLLLVLLVVLLILGVLAVLIYPLVCGTWATQACLSLDTLFGRSSARVLSSRFSGSSPDNWGVPLFMMAAFAVQDTAGSCCICQS